MAKKPRHSCIFWEVCYNIQMVNPTLSNPVDIKNIEPLNAAERAFAASLKEDKLGLSIGSRTIGDRPKKKIVGDNTNVIRAEVIRFFARGGNADYPVTGNIIMLHGAWVSGTLNLAHVPSPYALVFSNCHFDGIVMMPHSAFRFLNLSGSRLERGLTGDGMKIESDVLLHEDFASENEVCLSNAVIGGRVICNGGKFNSGDGKTSLNATGIRVGSDFTMGRGFSAEGEVRLLGADIGGDLGCDHGNFNNKNGVSIIADKIKVGGGVYMAEGFSAEGEVRLLNADIGMGLHCDGGKFINKAKDAFSADGMAVRGNVFMRNGFYAEGEVCLRGATISGDWYCGGGQFTNEKKRSILADRVTIGGNLFMQDGFAATGEVRLSGADIGESFSCDSGAFSNDGGNALVADGMDVKKNVFMQGGFCAKGVVRFLDGNIGNNLFCDGGSFKNADGKAFALDRSKINGDVFMRDGFCAEGEVRLLSVGVGGDLDCSGGNFSHPQGDAIMGDGIQVAGLLGMRDGFVANGRVNLQSASIGRDLSCNGGIFKNGIIAQAINIKNFFLWNNVGGGGTIDLSSAKAEVVNADKKSREGFNFILEGFSYSRFAGRINTDALIMWLTSHPGNDFSPQPFEQVASTLFAMGRDKDARRILFAMENIISAGGKIPKPSIVARAWSWLWERTGQPLWEWCGRPAWRWLLKIATGYNYLPSRMFWASAFFVILGTILFGAAEERGYIVPHQPVVLANSEYQKIVRGEETETQGYPANCPRPLAPTKAVRCLLPNYPKFCPFLFSLDVFIPVFSLHQEQYWFPKTPTDADSWLAKILPFWYWIEIIAGWVLVSIFGLTVTGIMQQRQATQSGK